MGACTIPAHIDVIPPSTKEKSSESELAVQSSRSKSARKPKIETTADTSSHSNNSHAPIHSNDDAISFILDSYESLIAHQIIHSPGIKPSHLAIRRGLYRKQFNVEAVRLLHKLPIASPSIDDLLQIIDAACRKCDVILVWPSFSLACLYKGPSLR